MPHQDHFEFCAHYVNPLCQLSLQHVGLIDITLFPTPLSSSLSLILVVNKNIEQNQCKEGALWLYTSDSSPHYLQVINRCR